MTPIILVPTGGPPIVRDGRTIEPKAELAFCEVCGEPAPYGYIEGGERRVYCNKHRPESAEQRRAG